MAVRAAARAAAPPFSRAMRPAAPSPLAAPSNGARAGAARRVVPAAAALADVTVADEAAVSIAVTVSEAGGPNEPYAGRAVADLIGLGTLVDLTIAIVVYAITNLYGSWVRSP